MPLVNFLKVFCWNSTLRSFNHNDSLYYKSNSFPVTSTRALAISYVVTNAVYGSIWDVWGYIRAEYPRYMNVSCAVPGRSTRKLLCSFNYCCETRRALTRTRIAQLHKQTIGKLMLSDLGNPLRILWSLKDLLMIAMKGRLYIITICSV